MLDFLDVVAMLSQCEDKEDRRKIVKDWQARELTEEELADLVSRALPS